MNNNGRYSKAQRRILKDLAAEVYQIELDMELDKLLAQFKSWKSGQIDSWDLEGAIHKFHQGPSRRLYSDHNNLDADFIIASALKRGIITSEKIPADLLENIRGIMTCFD